MTLIGCDYLSIEKFKRVPAQSHRVMLGAGIVIVEGLDLRSVPPGDYELICLPLRFDGAEAVPARVILRSA